ncbi:DUF2982 domain-containing protein [Rheinheimera sp.]|uniref:DUF2982 domain-containing protein n=1 Tax=Rheinheimera sp. TaxID=1869214 RepID=UPI00307CCA1C
MTPLQFQAKTAKGGASLLLWSSGLLLLWLLALAAFRELLPATAWAMLLLVCLIALVLAYARLTEPWLVLEATEQGLTFFHRKGNWVLPWQECGLVTVPELNGQELAYVGIRLKQQSPFLSRLSPRLAVALLMEQRNLLLSAVGQNCPTGQCPSAFFMETNPCLVEGKVYKGVIGMFGQRMQTLRQLIGFELYIPLNALSENPQIFCRTINQLRLQYSENTVT